MLRKKILLPLLAIFVGVMALACSSQSTGDSGPQRSKVRIMWSIYVGWMPWPYANDSGILKKWGDKYGVDFELVQADYIPSIEAYVAGQVDAVVMTNMEALNMAAAAGVDSTAVIMGDYSNGNDAVLTRNNLGLCDLAGKNVYLVEYSVSHYLLARGLETQCQGRVTERDLKLINTSDSDIGPAFISSGSQEAVVTWNPIVLEVRAQVPGTRIAYESSKTPYEILDLMVVRTDVLRRHSEVGYALAGAWYETLALMNGRTPEAEQALTSMAQRSGASLASYKKQLETTAMWWNPADAASFTRGQKAVEVMDLVRQFSYAHGLFGEKSKSVDDIGISFPDGTVLGNRQNVKLRMVDIYMQKAAVDMP